MVKSLGGTGLKPAAGLRDEDGVLLQDLPSIGSRWVRYTCELFKGRIADSLNSLKRGGPHDIDFAATSELCFLPTPELTRKVIAKLDGAGAVGPDALSADLLQVGAWAAATLTVGSHFSIRLRPGDLAWRSVRAALQKG